MYTNPCLQLSSNAFNFGSLPPPTQLNIYPKIKFPSPRFDSLSQQIPFHSSLANSSSPATAAGGPVTASSSAPRSMSSSSSASSRKAFKPKAKFTADDDDLLLELKENKKLSWKQIAEHFEGRTAGALQVRYCTKLKGRSLHWSLEDINALHEALEEYEEERWIIVSQKMGSKFTASICRDKFNELSGHGGNNNNYNNTSRKLF